jgi:hypothetical protein
VPGRFEDRVILGGTQFGARLARRCAGTGCRQGRYGVAAGMDGEVRQPRQGRPDLLVMDRREMNILDVGAKLASILSLLVAIGGYVNHRQNRRDDAAASTSKFYSIARLVRTMVIVVYVLTFSILASFFYLDYVIFLFFGVTSFVIGDLCGQILLNWVNGPSASDDQLARHRRADSIATTFWIVLLVALNLTAMVALFIYLPRVGILMQVILTCSFCAAVTFLPYHANIRAGRHNDDRSLGE